MQTIDRNRTVHISRTMMLSEATTLFEHVPAAGDLQAYRLAVVNDNVLLKRTVSNREKTFRFLRELYGLEQGDTLFSALRTLWDADPPGRPLIALLNAVYRDEVLRPSAEVIVAARAGAPVTKAELAASVRSVYPSRFGTKTLEVVGRNIASTWTQSGHLKGRVAKVRSQVTATVGPVTFALLLGWLDGQRGLALYESLWANLVTPSTNELDELAFVASNRTWLRYKRLGDVAEIDFAGFIRDLGGHLG